MAVDETSDLAEFTEQVASALFRAIDARPDRTNPTGGVTVGIWIDRDGQPPLQRLASEEPASSGTNYLSRRELRSLSTGGQLTQAGVGKLNDSIRDDPQLAQDLASSLLVDPRNWESVFELGDDLQAEFDDDDGDDGLIGLFEGMVRSTYGQLDELVLDIKTPSVKAAKKGKKDKKWYVPDKFEVKVEGSGSGAKVTGTLTWEF